MKYLRFLKLKEFITNRPVLQEMLKKSFMQKENDTRWKYLSVLSNSEHQKL